MPDTLRSLVQRLFGALALSLLVAGACMAAEPEPEPGDKGELPCKQVPPGQKIKVDLKDVELATVTRMVSCAAGMNFIFEPSTLGSHTVTVISARPVSVRAVVQLFWSALADAGLEAERRGAFYVIRKLSAPQVPSKRRSSKGR